MRNLKKVLTLVLTLAMLLSVMVVGAGAATFGDQESITNDEAVDMCVALNIIGGYEDGTFRPAGNVTRAEMCKMICVALNGGKEPTMGSGLIGTFNDVATSDWSAPYIEYCVSQGIVGGVGGGRFNPTGNITGTQAAKMLLCILGYDAAIQGYIGNDFWETKINVDAAQKGLYDELANIDASAPLTRDQAAQMIWNALNAYEVEYITTLVPGPNGTLVSKVDVRDKVVGETNDKITLLEDKYEADTSVTGIMTGYQWNETKGEYTYTLDTPATYSTKADFTDLYGMNVKVISAPDPKSTADKVYGIIPWDSKVVATGVLGDVEYDDTKAIKIDGTKYRTDNAAASLQAYSVNEYSEKTAVFAAEKLALRMEYTFSAIDNDGDNDIDCFVIYPFTVAKVSYVGTSSFNLDANPVMGVPARTSIKFENVNAYDGMAKDDYVKIVDGKYTADGDESFTKITDIVEGKVTSTKTGSAMIDGNWYDYDDTKLTPALALSSTYKLVMVNGYACASETITTGADVSDYAVVMSASAASGVDGNRVKLLFSDGKTEVVAAAADYSTYTDANANSQPDAGEYDWIDKLVTFEIDDGEYELTLAEAYPSGDADAAGFDEILNEGTAYNYVSGGDSTLGGKRIASDAVIFVKDGAGKYKVITGADLVKYNNASVDHANNVYANKNSSTGFSSVALAYVELAANVTIQTGNYGYVTSGIGSTKNDKNETVSVLSFWTAEGQVDDALADGVVNGVMKGSVITYEKNSDGSYAIKVAEGVTTDSVVSYDESAKRLELAAGGEMKITADTVILNIDSETVKGVEGNQILKAPETATPGVYEKNAYWVATGTDLDVIIIDTKNNLSVMPGAISSTPTTAQGVQDALNSATDVTLDTSGVNENVSVDVPEGSNVKVTNAASGNTLTLNAAEGSTVEVSNNANADKVTVNTVAGSTVTISGTTTKIPTITGDGNVVVNATIAGTFDAATGGFGGIDVNASTAATSTNPGTVSRGLELSGSGKITSFSGSKTFNELANLTGSTTVTPCKLSLDGVAAALGDNGGTLTSVMTLKDGKPPVAGIFSGDTTSTTITTANLDYPNGAETGMYMFATMGDNVKSVTYTIKALGGAKDGQETTWTFNIANS